MRSELPTDLNCVPFTRITKLHTSGMIIIIYLISCWEIERLNNGTFVHARTFMTSASGRKKMGGFFSLILERYFLVENIMRLRL